MRPRPVASFCQCGILSKKPADRSAAERMNRMHTANHAPLGFGLMRLPKVGEEIDVAQTSQMVDAFLAAGFTYFDTAYEHLTKPDK